MSEFYVIFAKDIFLDFLWRKCPLRPLLCLRLKFAPLLTPNPGDATGPDSQFYCPAGAGYPASRISGTSLT